MAREDRRCLRGKQPGLYAQRRFTGAPRERQAMAERPVQRIRHQAKITARLERWGKR
jgi:hypothetical protein